MTERLVIADQGPLIIWQGFQPCQKARNGVCQSGKAPRKAPSRQGATSMDHNYLIPQRLPPPPPAATAKLVPRPKPEPPAPKPPFQRYAPVGDLYRRGQSTVDSEGSLVHKNNQGKSYVEECTRCYQGKAKCRCKSSWVSESPKGRITQSRDSARWYDEANNYVRFHLGGLAHVVTCKLCRQCSTLCRCRT